MPAKKYISIINKGGNNIYIKDAEAREALVIYNDVYLGTGSSAASVMIEDNHHDTLSRGTYVILTASSNKIWVILPNTFNPTVTMNGMEIPLTYESSITVDDITYRVMSSTNTYAGTFSVCLA